MEVREDLLLFDLLLLLTSDSAESTAESKVMVYRSSQVSRPIDLINDYSKII